jgi:hypothetical protein
VLSSPIPAWLGPVGGRGDNDNRITFSNGSSEVQVDSSGLNIVTSETTLTDYSTFEEYADCTDDCGTYAALFVQLYSSAASPRVACSPVFSLSSSSQPRASLSSTSSKKKK